MKTNLKIAIGIIAIVALCTAGGSTLLLLNSSSNLNPQTIPIPQPTTPINIAPPIPSTPITQPTISITYHNVRLDCGRQCLDINITNQGYSSFSTDPAKFYVTIGGHNFTYSAAFTPTWGDWAKTTVENNASYQGTILFDTPYTNNPFTLGYNDSTYNIQYVYK